MEITVLVIIGVYIIGCILALGVIGGLQWDIENKSHYKYHATIIDIVKNPDLNYYIVLSWICMLAGLISIIMDTRRNTFIKYNFTKLK
jgi:amino acid transporter